MRRCAARLDKLIVVESPNKVGKITAYLSGTNAVEDWSFGKKDLRAASWKNEKVVVLATVGHFKELKDIKLTPTGKVVAQCAPVAPTVKSAKRSKTGRDKGKAAKVGASDATTVVPQENVPLLSFSSLWISKTSKTITQDLQSMVAQLGDGLSEVILAADPDREGELIAAHALEAVKAQLAAKKIPYSRAYIQSITKDGIHQAMKERRLNFVDTELVCAADARHIMDRIFGFLGSGLVRNINPELRSIGRVQTPSLIAVANREKRIEEYTAGFRPSYFLQGKCTVHGSSRNVTLHLREDKQLPEDSLRKMMDQLDLAKSTKFSCRQTDVVVTDVVTEPPRPFTMASLIMRANKQLHMSTEEVSATLQELFQSGLITYPRTDSERIDPSVLPSIQAFAAKEFGKESVAQSAEGKAPDASKKSTKKVEGNVEDAHEAIRPTDINILPRSVQLSRNSTNLYALIHANTLASVMTPYVVERVAAKVSCVSGGGAPLWFQLESRRVKVPGFTSSLKDRDEDDSSSSDATDSFFKTLLDLPKILVEAPTVIVLSEGAVKETKPNPPPAFSEGLLVEELRRNGVGRPSTYPTIVSTLLQRGYVIVNTKGRIETTALGRLAAHLATTVFPRIVDMKFTSEFEKLLDVIARGAGPEASDAALSRLLSDVLQCITDATQEQRVNVLVNVARTKAAIRNEKVAEESILRKEALQRVKQAVPALQSSVLAKPTFSSICYAVDDFLRANFPRGAVSVPPAR
jgi:DNA topoisomerase IA